MVSASVDRVPEHTAAEINERIAREIEGRVVACAVRVRDAKGRLEEIDNRLRELDREWDIERVLQANAAVASLVGVFLAVTVSRKWLVLPAAVAGFLMQHAAQGWCPPLPMFRRWGVRTPSEIARERFALKALRGDFDNLPGSAKTADAERAQAALRSVLA